MSFTSKFRPLMASAFVRAPLFSSRTSFASFKPLVGALCSQQGEDFSSSSRSSWMDKNEDFKGNDPEPRAKPNRFADRNDGNGRNKTDKQRRRRTDQRNEDFNEKQHFRDNFRGTRVFVQGIPVRASWQDLKDHFKVAGDVVFASVSIDPSTGASKGCGVVQYESTEMATNAIKVMRDHPMDGSALYVREDHQENKEGRELKEKRGSTPPSTWRCADETNLALLSENDNQTVRNLIKSRDQARKTRNFDVSDMIRQDLKKKFSVHIDDRMKLWWVSSDNAVPQSVSDANGDGRWGKPKAWSQIPTTFENDACVNPDLINGLLAQRDISRLEKDFSTADRLLEEARTAPDGDLNLRIHDESRTWRIWTEAPPPREIHHENPRMPRMGPAEQCLAIVEKHEPTKINEVKALLMKFPGREYSILKKLKSNYNV